MLTQKAIFLVCVLTAIAFGFFTIIAFNSGANRENLEFVEVSFKMEAAFGWTLRACGCLITIIAAIHLILFAAQGALVEKMVPGAIALLGGLLLVSQYWVLIVVFGVLCLAFMLQQLVLRLVSVKGTVVSPAPRNRGANDYGLEQPGEPVRPGL